MSDETTRSTTCAPWEDDLAFLSRTDLLTAGVVSVQSSHRRSLCYFLHLGDGSALFVKRAVRISADAWSADVDEEARKLRLLEELGVDVPHLVHVSDNSSVRALVTEYLPDRQPLHERRRRHAAEGVPAAAGRTLRALHAVPVRNVPAADGLPFVHPAHLVEPLLVLTPTAVVAFAPAFFQLHSRLRELSLQPVLENALSDWSGDRLIHGDVKSDNVLCRSGQRPVRLVDWELAGRGDSRWDVGSLLGDHIFFWLMSAHHVAGGNLAEWVATAERDPCELARDLREVVRAYLGDGDAPPDDPLVWMRYAGVFLLHRALVQAHRSSALGSRMLLVVQAAAQLLRRPEQWWEFIS